MLMACNEKKQQHFQTNYRANHKKNFVVIAVVVKSATYLYIFLYVLFSKKGQAKEKAIKLKNNNEFMYLIISVNTFCRKKKRWLAFNLKTNFFLSFVLLMAVLN
jgi:hypothetical protein